MNIPRMPKTLPYGQLSLLEHTILATMVLIGARAECGTIITPPRQSLLLTACQRPSSNSTAAIRVSPPLTPSTPSNYHSFSLKDICILGQILNKTTDMAYNTLHI